jgi:predicted transcriptional regulator
MAEYINNFIDYLYTVAYTGFTAYMEELVKKLAPLGLTEKEARVYLALLQLGNGSAYSVALKSALKKPTAYVILDELVEKGLAYVIPREKKKRYAAIPPEELMQRAEERFATAQETLPELLSLYKSNTVQSKARTLYFDGVSGVRQALEYREKELRGKEIIGFFCTTIGRPPEILQLYFEWNAHHRKYGTKLRGFTTTDESLEGIIKDNGPEHYSNLRVLPRADYLPLVSIDSALDFVRIQITAASQIVIIESVDFAQSFRQIFELAWKNFNDAKTVKEAYFDSQEKQ